jgi:hypothetical protein
VTVRMFDGCPSIKEFNGGGSERVGREVDLVAYIARIKDQSGECDPSSNGRARYNTNVHLRI